jgi:hypothetical protein
MLALPALLLPAALLRGTLILTLGPIATFSARAVTIDVPIRALIPTPIPATIPSTIAISILSLRGCP